MDTSEVSKEQLIRALFSMKKYYDTAATYPIFAHIIRKTSVCCRANFKESTECCT